MAESISKIEEVLTLLKQLQPEMDNFQDISENRNELKRFQEFYHDCQMNEKILKNLDETQTDLDASCMDMRVSSTFIDSKAFSKSVSDINSKSIQLQSTSKLSDIVVKIDTFKAKIKTVTRSQSNLDEKNETLLSKTAQDFLINCQKLKKFYDNFTTTFIEEEEGVNAIHHTDNIPEHLKFNFNKDVFNIENVRKQIINLEQLINLLKTETSSDDKSTLIYLLKSHIFKILPKNYLSNTFTSMVKFTDFVYSVLLIVTEKGFCRPKEIDQLENEIKNEENGNEDNDEDDDDDNGDQAQGLADTNDDLSGANDVTNQIEEEWQLEGLRDKEDQEEKDKDKNDDDNDKNNDNNQEKQEQDNAMEVEDLEFDGDYEDVPDKTREELEEENENIEDKMDNFDENEDNQENKETLDDRMWGDENDDDDDKKDDDKNKKEDEKFEDTEGKGMDKKDEFLGAKDDRLLDMDDNDDDQKQDQEEQKDDNEMNDDREFDENEYDDNFEGIDKDKKKEQKDNAEEDAAQEMDEDTNFDNDELDKDKLSDVEENEKGDEDDKIDGAIKDNDDENAEQKDEEEENQEQEADDPNNEFETGEYEVDPYQDENNENEQGEEEELDEQKDLNDPSNATLMEDNQTSADNQQQNQGQGLDNHDNENEENLEDQEEEQTDNGQEKDVNAPQERAKDGNKKRKNTDIAKMQKSLPKRKKQEDNSTKPEEQNQKIDFNKENFESKADITDKKTEENQEEDEQGNKFEKDQDAEKIGMDTTDKAKSNLNADDMSDLEMEDEDDEKTEENNNEENQSEEEVADDDNQNVEKSTKNNKPDLKSANYNDEAKHENESDNESDNNDDFNEQKEVLDYDSFFHAAKSVYSEISGQSTTTSSSTTRPTEDQIRAALESKISSFENLSPEDSDKLQTELEQSWIEYLALTQNESQFLCEQLRIILEPNQTSKLKGDYKSGKRLNMKKVIGYIASNFRRDKIWLRRTKPSKRTYQIMLSIDNSKSMKYNKLQQMAFESIAILSASLSLLDIGQLGICTFGENINILHQLDKSWTSKDEKYDLSAGSKILAGLKFDQSKTETVKFLNLMTEYMSRLKQPNSPQLHVILSDGKGLFYEEGGRTSVEYAIQEASSKNLFTILIILDSDESSKNSVVETKKAVFNKDGSISLKAYLEDFPFKHYLIIRNLNELPGVLSAALRSWIDMLSS